MNADDRRTLRMAALEETQEQVWRDNDRAWVRPEDDETALSPDARRARPFPECYESFLIRVTEPHG